MVRRAWHHARALMCCLGLGLRVCTPALTPPTPAKAEAEASRAPWRSSTGLCDWAAVSKADGAAEVTGTCRARASRALRVVASVEEAPGQF